MGPLGPAYCRLCGEGRNLRELPWPGPTHRPRLSAAEQFPRRLAHPVGIGRQAGSASRLEESGEDFSGACQGLLALRGNELRNDPGARSTSRAGKTRAEGSRTMMEVVLIKLVLAGIVFFAALNLAGFHTWEERKQSAPLQDRYRGNRAYIFGFRMLGMFHAVAG